MSAQDKNPAIAMAMALALQESINVEDLEWLRSREDLDDDARFEIFARMVARGGSFLTLIEKIVGFTDTSYERLPILSEIANTHGSSKPEWFDEVYARLEAGKQEWIKQLADQNRANTKK